MSNQSRPRLSEFTRPSKKRPQDNAISNDVRSPSSQKTLDELTPPETSTEKEAKDRIKLYEQMQDTMSPVENYQQYLKELKISEDDAARIVDDLMTKGYYEENFKISKTRRCALRTRAHRDTMRLQIAMQVQRPLFQASLDELQARYNMAASLAAYNDENYYFPTATDSQEKVDKLFDERLKAVELLPAPIFSMISTLLAKFDHKVFAVLRSGVAENF